MTDYEALWAAVADALGVLFVKFADGEPGAQLELFTVSEVAR